MLREYFTLQFRMLNRRFEDSGVTPWLAWILSAIAFTGFSFFLFHRTTYAPYIMVLLSVSVNGRLSEKKRNEFLSLLFRRTDYLLLRILENLFCLMPFFIFLLLRKQWLSALFVILVNLVLAMNRLQTEIRLTLPTPFSKRPFEFCTGFRATWILLTFGWIITGIAVFVNNSALGIFAVLLLFAIAFSYYTKPENEFFVWTYRLSPVGFLIGKIRTALLYTSALVWPPALLLAFFFRQDIMQLLIVIGGAYAMLICIVCAKYASYPEEIGIVPGILIAFCLYFPPLLVLLIPFFFRQALYKLKPYLV